MSSCLKLSHFLIFILSFLGYYLYFENKDLSNDFCTFEWSLAVLCERRKFKYIFCLPRFPLLFLLRTPQCIHCACTYSRTHSFHPPLPNDSLCDKCWRQDKESTGWASALKQLQWKPPLMWSCIRIESIRTKLCYNKIASSLLTSKTHGFLIVLTSESNTVPDHNKTFNSGILC